ncbi:MAG: Asp-tRNA(Asn)/Glu-tRNA(Gln) amidotransferase subunit GatC [Acidimicrobiia bacterium]
MTEPRITRADAEHVARLARLELTDEELEAYTGQLASILEYADDIAALDTDNVPPTSHPLPLRNVLRPDEVRPSLDRDEVLRAAPDATDGRFRVPPVLGEQT